MTTYVYDFSQGSKEMADLLGGKGANLAEMTRLGLPVPPGFTITTEACRAYLADGAEPAGLHAEISAHLTALEAVSGHVLGQNDDPLLVSVRSGARFSMPGMMDTVLNVGLTDDSVAGLAARTEDERFAWDAYRRLLQMFGRTVMGVNGDQFEKALESLEERRSARSELDLTAGDLMVLAEEFKTIIRDHTGREFPQNPREQLDMAVRAVFDSWNTERARIYRRQEGIPEDLGTAVNVMEMVFGNLGPGSGTGVAFTRDPAAGRSGVYGDYLTAAQGEDVVAGIRNTIPLQRLETIDQPSYRQLLRNMERLERHYRDMCDIEFTIERGRLWMLQTRVGKRTAEAAFRIAVALLDDGLIDEDEALARVTGHQLARLLFPRFDHAVPAGPLTRAVAASPGAAVGAAVFDPETAVAWARAGKAVILIRHETTPDDLAGMIAARGILTIRGGKTSHAAVVARGMGRTCVCGAERLILDAEARSLVAPDGTVVAEGDLLSIDGTDGAVYRGQVPVVSSPVARYFEEPSLLEDDLYRESRGEPLLTEDERSLVVAVDRLMGIADARRRLGVRANADTPADAARARRFGAEGIGLCRTEHMFLGERRHVVERLILAETDARREAALAELLPLQRDDFVGILTAMNGLPVTIRLLDPPLHEFLPDLTDLSVKVAAAKARGAVNPDDMRLLAAVRRLHEQNPMLGLRGVRLGLVVPGLYAMQVRAIAEAAVHVRDAGGQPDVEIMIPLVGAVEELRLIREECEGVVRRVGESAGLRGLTFPIGTMIELPRAALTAGRIARAADFFSFGTNDLTQTTWGFSRDDVESAFFGAYLDRGVFDASPFESIDADGVGELVSIATERGRAAHPGLRIGVCGEHGGDPASIHFFHRVGVDYVSCSPFRIPIARLEAGRAAVEAAASDTR